jgi:hypothetical protein
MDLHKLLVPVGYDKKEKMSSIFTHIHLRVVNHVIIHTYVESYTRVGCDGCSIQLHHLIDIGCFPELDDLIRNPRLEMFYL